jgi:hypothetical protein
MCRVSAFVRCGVRCAYAMLFFLSCCLAVVATHSDQIDKLKGDERLAVEVDLSISGEPLPVLCEALSEATGAKIWADGQVAREKVVVFCKGRPAAHVMAHVADLFGYTWEVEKREGEEPKYKLFQDSASVDRDQELKKAYLAARWDACWQTISETADLWDKYKDDTEALETARKAQDDFESGARGYQDVTEEEWRQVGALRCPRKGMFASFVRALPQSKLDMLAEGERLVFSTYFADSEWRLDPEFAEEVARAPIDRFPPNAEAGAEMPPEPEGRSVGAVLSLRFCPVEAGRQLRRGVGLYGAFCARYTGGTVSDSESPSLIGPLQAVEWTVRSSEEIAALAEEFPWLEGRITVELPEEDREPGRSKEYWLPELLRMVHDAAGVPIISDAYWTKGRSKVLEAKNMRLEDYLRHLCSDDTYVAACDVYTWTPRDGWLRLRCGVYPIARMEELPEDLVKRLQAIHKQGKDPGLLELAEIAGLSDWQRAALEAGLTPEGVGAIPPRIEEHLDSLRICSKIKPAQAKDDDFSLVLRYPEMTQDQQQTFIDHLAGPRVALWPGLSDLPNCTFEVSCGVKESFMNNPEDWPRAKIDAFEFFVWNGADPKEAEAAYQQFIKENPGVLKTKLHHFRRKSITFTYRLGDEVLDKSTPPLLREEVNDQEREAGAQG